MVKKIICMGVALIMCMSLFCACGKEEEIDFSVGSAWGEGQTEMIVRSLDEWNNFDDSKTITIDEKYDNEFFADNALVIVAFRTTSGGCGVEEIKVLKRGNRLTVDINGMDGVMTVIGGIIVVLEVKKDDVVGVKTVRFTTNITQPK